MDTFRVLKWSANDIGLPHTVPGRKIVHFGLQHGVPYVWTEVPEGKEAHVTFVILPTGYTIIDENIKHVQTIQDGEFVWHLYQED